MMPGDAKRAAGTGTSGTSPTVENANPRGRRAPTDNETELRLGWRRYGQLAKDGGTYIREGMASSGIRGEPRCRQPRPGTPSTRHFGRRRMPNPVRPEPKSDKSDADDSSFVNDSREYIGRSSIKMHLSAGRLADASYALHGLDNRTIPVYRSSRRRMSLPNKRSRPIVPRIRSPQSKAARCD